MCSMAINRSEPAAKSLPATNFRGFGEVLSRTDCRRLAYNRTQRTCFDALNPKAVSAKLPAPNAFPGILNSELA